MSKFDFQSLNKKNINEILVIAENLSKKNLEEDWMLIKFICP